MFITSRFKLYFCLQIKQITDFEMPLGWKNLKLVLLLRKKIRQDIQELKQSLLFRNSHWKDCMNFFEEISMLRESLNAWECLEVKDKTFTLLTHMLRFVSTEMESAEATGFVENIPLFIIKLKMKSGKI